MPSWPLGGEAELAGLAVAGSHSDDGAERHEGLRAGERVAGALTGTGAELHRNYVPGCWIPHVSVATRAHGASMATVLTTVADVLPLPLHVDRAALIDSSTGQLWPLDHVP